MQDATMMPSTTTILISLALGVAQTGVEPARPTWRTMQLSDGVELLYVPVAVTMEDYPKGAMRNGEEGTSLLSLQLSPQGQLLSCTTARSSGWPVLDEKACQLYRARGRFELRGASQPVTVQAPVQWMLVD